MTSRIHRLDSTTVGRIAAGEVIERPASVVKELLDNALDAGSRRIDIELRNGGRQLIQVTDNGCGMTAEEAVLALQRFTTSKIRHIDDLTTLTTLGFRGEALPSIAAVAEIDILTRPAEVLEGVQVRSRSGQAPQVQPAGCPPGTCVRVYHLFQQVPVRLRALKAVHREVQVIQELVAHYALAHPLVTIQLQHEARRLLFAPASADLRQRLASLVSSELALHMLPLQWQTLDLGLEGAVSAPSLHRATRQRQYYWVNGRPVRSPLLSAAVQKAYGALLPAGRHPVVALGLHLAPTLLDVNVHPRKTEVTFVHERAVFSAVEDALAPVLQGLVSGSTLPWEAARVPVAWEPAPQAALSVNDPAPAYQVLTPESPPVSLQALGQVGDTFLIASGPQGLLILDQHAAHESLLYEQLMAAPAHSVELAEAFVLPLNARQEAYVTRLQPVLTTLGLLLEPFGQHRLLVRAVPQVLQDVLRPPQLLEALQEAMQRTPPQATPEIGREHLAAALACRTALRAGEPLSPAHMTELLTAVSQQRLAYTCPHGRPTYVTLSLAELERRFLRLTERGLR
ncbi:MAG: DNA mismatch repair endonuclease MutL [Candidatus Tectimicrobiota bacterium]